MKNKTTALVKPREIKKFCRDPPKPVAAIFSEAAQQIVERISIKSNLIHSNQILTMQAKKPPHITNSKLIYLMVSRLC